MNDNLKATIHGLFDIASCVSIGTTVGTFLFNWRLPSIVFGLAAVLLVSLKAYKQWRTSPVEMLPYAPDKYL